MFSRKILIPFLRKSSVGFKDRVSYREIKDIGLVLKDFGELDKEKNE